jgi:hypothetical protein
MQVPSVVDGTEGGDGTGVGQAVQLVPDEPQIITIVQNAVVDDPVVSVR